MLCGQTTGMSFLGAVSRSGHRRQTVPVIVLSKRVDALTVVPNHTQTQANICVYSN